MCLHKQKSQRILYCINLQGFNLNFLKLIYFLNRIYLLIKLNIFSNLYFLRFDPSNISLFQMIFLNQLSYYILTWINQNHTLCSFIKLFCYSIKSFLSFDKILFYIIYTNSIPNLYLQTFIIDINLFNLEIYTLN